MSLSDHLDKAAKEAYARHQPPPDYKPGAHIVGDTGTAMTEATEDEVYDHDELLKLAHLDPTKWRITDPTKIDARIWQTYDERWLHYYKFVVHAIDPTFDLPALIAAGKRAAKSKGPTLIKRPDWLGAVVVWADPQTGKSDVRGGFEELSARVADVQVQLGDWLKEEKPTESAFCDVGDGVEGFENTAQQAHTNGLSFMDQIDAESTFEFDTIETMAQRGKVTVAKTTSNHAAWRKGKDYLGKPGDDWGLHIGRQLIKQFRPTKYDTEFLFSQPWDHSMSFDFGGTIIGLHHGHMVNRPEQIPDWWARQTHGAGAVADADILLTGHFHHYLGKSTGRNRLSGKVKWWFQAPTLDNGSSWYRNRYGDDSDPGLLVFLVDENGFIFRSMNIIQPRVIEPVV